VQQHELALKRANEIRLETAEIKRKLKADEISIVHVLMEPPACLNNYQIFEIIMSMDRWGRERTKRLFTKLGLSEWVTFSRATDRQIRLLAEYFDT